MKLDMGQEWMVHDTRVENSEELDDLDTMDNHEALLDNHGIDSAEDGFIRGFNRYAHA